MRKTILKNMNVDQQILIANKNVHSHGYLSAPGGRNASMWMIAILGMVTLISMSPLRTSAQPTCDPLVLDVEPPLITCSADLTINSDPGECFTTTTLTAPAVSDNCDGVLGNALDFDGPECWSLFVDRKDCFRGSDGTHDCELRLNSSDLRTV